MSKLKIDSISVDNLRGYSSTSLRIRPMTILVGENNQGKSSLLKMLEWMFNKSGEFWESDRRLSDSDLEFWSPANDVKHKARRFALNIRFVDGRVARRFSCKKGHTLALRLAIGLSDQSCRLNMGLPKRSESHEVQAAVLLATVRKHINLIVLPPVRDGGSSSFAAKVTRDVKARIQTKLAHSRRAGAPKEYRLMHEVLDKLKKVVELNTRELARSNDSPLGAMLRASEVRLDLHTDDIAKLIEGALTVYLSTGTHDELKVLPSEVGNGLQSLLDINLSVEEVGLLSKDVSTIVIIEEPEAFLHPAAQRQFMDFLRNALSRNLESAILTTHSPFIIDEGRYGEIVIVREQKHHEPAVLEARRISINTALMTTSTAEILFARTICFVEGEGDRSFFNTLVRRIRKLAPICPEISGLVFQATGSCSFFAPWLHLVKSYTRGSESPFNTVWIMDGDAATKGDGKRAVLGLASECTFSLTQPETDAVVGFGDLDWTQEARVAGANYDAVRVLREHGGYLFCGDLEWAIFNGVTPTVFEALKRTLSSCGISTTGTHVEIARRLGSKIGGGASSSRPHKAPFVRAAIAGELDLSSLPPEIFTCLDFILGACFKTEQEKAHFLAKTGVKACALTH